MRGECEMHILKSSLNTSGRPKQISYSTASVPKREYCQQKTNVHVLFWSSVLPSFWVHAEQVKASLSKSNMDAETLLSIWDAEHGVITDELRAYAKM